MIFLFFFFLGAILTLVSVLVFPSDFTFLFLLQILALRLNHNCPAFLTLLKHCYKSLLHSSLNLTTTGIPENKEQPTPVDQVLQLWPVWEKEDHLLDVIARSLRFPLSDCLNQSVVSEIIKKRYSNRQQPLLPSVLINLFQFQAGLHGPRHSKAKRLSKFCCGTEILSCYPKRDRMEDNRVQHIRLLASLGNSVLTLYS